VVSAHETKGIPAAHAAIVCSRKSLERRRRRETADKAAEERQSHMRELVARAGHNFCEKIRNQYTWT